PVPPGGSEGCTVVRSFRACSAVGRPTGKTYSPCTHLVTSSREPYRSFQRSPGAFLPQELRPPPSHRVGRRSHRPPPLSFPLPGLARLLPTGVGNIRPVAMGTPRELWARSVRRSELQSG